jgi:hypothetical protein
VLVARVQSFIVAQNARAFAAEDRAFFNEAKRRLSRGQFAQHARLSSNADSITRGRGIAARSNWTVHR